MQGGHWSLTSSSSSDEEEEETGPATGRGGRLASQESQCSSSASVATEAQLSPDGRGNPLQRDDPPLAPPLAAAEDDGGGKKSEGAGEPPLLQGTHHRGGGGGGGGGKKRMVLAHQQVLSSISYSSSSIAASQQRRKFQAPRTINSGSNTAHEACTTRATVPKKSTTASRIIRKGALVSGKATSSPTRNKARKEKVKKTKKTPAPIPTKKVPTIVASTRSKPREKRHRDHPISAQSSVINKDGDEEGEPSDSDNQLVGFKLGKSTTSSSSSSLKGGQTKRKGKARRRKTSLPSELVLTVAEGDRLCEKIQKALNFQEQRPPTKCDSLWELEDEKLGLGPLLSMPGKEAQESGWDDSAVASFSFQESQALIQRMSRPELERQVRKLSVLHAGAQASIYDDAGPCMSDIIGWDAENLWIWKAPSHALDSHPSC